MPKKILHIIQSLENGGCENMLLRILPILSDTFEHRIITLKNPGQLALQFEEKNIPVSTVHQKNIFDRRGYRNLLSETKEFSPDIVLTYLFHADMIGRLFLQPTLSLRAKRGNPVPIIPFLRTTYNHPKYQIARLFEKATRNLVPCYLANSEAVKNFYISEIGVPAEKITVIPNGIDTDFFDSIVPDPNLRKSLNISPSDFVIISVANLHPNKGHRSLLEAFEQLHLNNNKAITTIKPCSLKLLIVGDGTERKNLEQQIASYHSKENILFLGRRTDVPELLTISDCFVLPTLFEGMSNAIMEAMAAGLPVITTNIPENRILILHEKNGILTKIADTKEIAQSISLLKKDAKKRSGLAHNARQSIHDNFSIKNTVKQWKKFLS